MTKLNQPNRHALYLPVHGPRGRRIGNGPAAPRRHHCRQARACIALVRAWEEYRVVVSMHA